MSKKTNSIANKFIRRQYGLDQTQNFQLKLFKDRLSIAKNLFKRDLVSHFGCVNAIEWSNNGNFLTSGWCGGLTLIFTSFSSLKRNIIP